MNGDPGRRAVLLADIRLLARLIRDNPDLPDARRMWVIHARSLAVELAGGKCPGTPPGPDIGDLLAWCARACGTPARLVPDGGSATRGRPLPADRRVQPEEPAA